MSSPADPLAPGGAPWPPISQGEGRVFAGPPMARCQHEWVTQMIQMPGGYQKPGASKCSKCNAFFGDPPKMPRCEHCKAVNVLLLALAGHHDKVTTEEAYNGVEAVRQILHGEVPNPHVQSGAPAAVRAPRPQLTNEEIAVVWESSRTLDCGANYCRGRRGRSPSPI